ncbi:MAG: FG-GAP-like repeat-containing protein, partial [Myxococcota bacterium]
AELAIGAALAEEGGAVGGAVYTIDGAVSGTVDLTGAAPRIEGGATRDAAGRALLAGDVDGDGVAELIVAGEANLTEVRVFAGPTGVAPFDVPDARVHWDAGILSAWSVGDGNDDGAVDLLVGHRAGDGAVLALVPGPIAGDVAVADAAWSVAEAAETFGGVHLGDLDGDGVGDLAVGVPGYPLLPWGDGWTAGASPGVAYLVLGPIGAPSLADADAVLYASGVDDRVGAGLARHDLDGDGAAELLATAGGALWGVPWAPGAGRVSDRATTVLTADGGIGGVGVGDLDGDGRGDVALGATGARDDGVVGVLYGPLVGAVDVAMADAAILGIPGGRFGGEVSVVPDLDGDGTDELVVRDSENRGAFYGGVAALFYGRAR